MLDLLHGNPAYFHLFDSRQPMWEALAAAQNAAIMQSVRAGLPGSQYNALADYRPRRSVRPLVIDEWQKGWFEDWGGIP